MSSGQSSIYDGHVTRPGGSPKRSRIPAGTRAGVDIANLSMSSANQRYIAINGLFQLYQTNLTLAGGTRTGHEVQFPRDPKRRGGSRADEPAAHEYLISRFLQQKSPATVASRCVALDRPALQRRLRRHSSFN